MIKAIDNNDLVEINNILNKREIDINQNYLFYAVQKRNIKICSLLIRHGVDINFYNEDEYSTPLIEAVDREFFDIFKLLIDNGADINFATESGITALVRAVENHNLKISKLLIDCEADTNVIYYNNQNLLHAATGNGIQDERIYKICKLLVKKGCDVNHKDSNFQTPIFNIIWKQYKSYPNDIPIKISKLFIKHGADINVFSNYSNDSPLRRALSYDNFDLSKLFIEHGATINDNLFLLNPLRNGKYKICKLLLNPNYYLPNVKHKIVGIDINTFDYDLKKKSYQQIDKCLKKINYQKYCEIFMLLLDNGINIDDKLVDFIKDELDDSMMDYLQFTINYRLNFARRKYLINLIDN
jgi:ankyrin repeat protein